MKKGETIQIKGEVVSVKPKWDRYDKQAVGIVVKSNGNPFWFQWTPQRSTLNRGDTVELTGVVNGQGEGRKKGDPPMIFLNQVQMSGAAECGHTVVVQKNGGHVCDACGEPMTVATTASLKRPA